MQTRRTFIQATMALGAAYACPGVCEAQSRLPLHTVVYDQRYKAASQFGRQAALYGGKVDAISGDVTALWFNDLSYHWRREPGAIAGMTDHSAWFVLDMMARDAGLRTVFAIHHANWREFARHEIFGPRQWNRPQKILDYSHSGWPAAVADLMVDFPASRALLARSNTSIASLRNRSIENRDLVSWLIAEPVDRAAKSIYREELRA